MRILFDQSTPVPLRHELVGHAVETAYERGWSTLANGDLLTAAEAFAFGILLTTDQSLCHQQDFSHRMIALVVLPTTRWPEIRQHVSEIEVALVSVRPGECLEVKW